MAADAGLGLKGMVIASRQPERRILESLVEKERWSKGLAALGSTVRASAGIAIGTLLTGTAMAARRGRQVQCACAVDCSHHLDTDRVQTFDLRSHTETLEPIPDGSI